MLIDERFFRLRDEALCLVSIARREGYGPEDMGPQVDEWIEDGRCAGADRVDLLALAADLYAETLFLPGFVLWHQ